MEHYKVTFKPDNKQIAIHQGATILEAAAQADIILNAVCGGKGTCGKCLVNIEPHSQPVLACQYHIHSDLVVTIPNKSRFYEQRILTEGVNLNNNHPPDIFQKYQPASRTGSKIFGVAVDLGTTTVVAKLIDMTDGSCLATEAAVNPQSHFGDDVITRIALAQTQSGLVELHNLIIGCINDLVEKLCHKAYIKSTSIYEMCLVGNTAMHHIFLSLPVSQLGIAPYKPYSLEAKDLSPADLSIMINPAGNIHTVENIAGFVGSDTIAAALAVDIASANQMTLLVDIGTNGEIVLGTSDKLYAASCAAGPAFEGARISSGSRAVDGAIEAVVVNTGDIDIDVIGDRPASSICGSGLLDALAVMAELGIIDSTGRFSTVSALRKTLPPAILNRIVVTDTGPAFCLAFNPDGQPMVTVTQNDVRQTQLAKGAIRAGIKILQKQLALEDSDISHIFLAGAFGNYLSPQSAIKIGLLPNLPIERIRFVGNAACAGAEMILLSRHARPSALGLARKIEYIELANSPDFHEVFADSMLF